MKTDVLTLDAKKAGNIDLDEAIFGVSARADILHRVVNWQLAKRRAGTHAVKFRSDIARTGARFGRQKGGGTARHGSRRSNIFVGGGRAFGPIPRDHGFSLPKKVRKLGLKSALSAKQADGKLIVVETAELKDGKTKELQAKLEKLGVTNALFVDGAEVNANFLRAAQNIPNVDVLPSQGANVYDILRRDTLVLTKAAVENLGERLK
ncbi:MAG: 50S ribosomal protein L4 [Kordiimonadaceae bacterium]|nr:50S ribosomal protein L4 [Kordiimonadaceae bacterium]MBO6569790.1 50S ribosomal protein L4 [Kordiimonadaceae bacterium]MBO6966114.1 50S ribosomal protein L4 [Kordiimonadaceae bacterium]